MVVKGPHYSNVLMFRKVQWFDIFVCWFFLLDSVFQVCGVYDTVEGALEGTEGGVFSGQLCGEAEITNEFSG